MKKPISATVEEDLIQWVNESLKDRTKFRNKSHLIEIALENLRKKEGKDWIGDIETWLFLDKIKKIGILK